MCEGRQQNSHISKAASTACQCAFQRDRFMKETQISSDQTTSCVFFDPECEIISSERVKEGQALFFDFFLIFYVECNRTFSSQEQSCEKVAVWFGLGTKTTWLGFGEDRSLG